MESELIRTPEPTQTSEESTPIPALQEALGMDVSEGENLNDKSFPPPRGGLVDFYDGADHVRPFSQTPKYVDQIFQRPQLC